MKTWLIHKLGGLTRQEHAKICNSQMYGTAALIHDKSADFLDDLAEEYKAKEQRFKHIEKQAGLNRLWAHQARERVK